MSSGNEMQNLLHQGPVGGKKFILQGYTEGGVQAADVVRLKIDSIVCFTLYQVPVCSRGIKNY